MKVQPCLTGARTQEVNVDPHMCKEFTSTAKIESTEWRSFPHTSWHVTIILEVFKQVNLPIINKTTAWIWKYYILFQYLTQRHWETSSLASLSLSSLHFMGSEMLLVINQQWPQAHTRVNREGIWEIVLVQVNKKKYNRDALWKLSHVFN